MTLILTLASIHYILQVGDRLVTLHPGGKTFDPMSNKNVVYLAKDAIVSIGYSGPAYLDDVPTDQWIAQKLRGEDFAGDRWAMHMGRASRWFDIGQSVELLRQQCEGAFARLPDPVSLELVIAGWQWRRRHARPIVWEITNTASDPRVFEKTAPNRHWYLEKPNRFAIYSTPNNNPLSDYDFQAVGERLKSAYSAEQSLSLLVDTIRLAARKMPIVGPHCMSILLPPPGFRKVLVRYLPATAQEATISTAQKEVTVPAAFCPGIVGPQIAVRPSILVGAWQVQLGPFEVTLEAPETGPDTSIKAIFSSQRRPPGPPQR